MRKIAAVLICLAVAMIVAGCQNEDEGKDRRLAAVEDMLEAILDDDLSKMKRLYVEGANPSPETILKDKQKWGISGLDAADFQISEASIHVFHAAYKMENTGQPGTIAFRIRNDPDKGVMIDFIGYIKETKKQEIR
ncbi:hypothetical protein MOF38_10990 [Bacillus haynesii]|uniref:Lipoprotein n=1 Tax=Bacillus haynesii TaxID=1925021 RepID=A0ABX3I5D1_9BACI|nr:hypothetical protein [Bacillus haynesii]MCI4130158.1 hypothetical protein [Bacillus haynesii]MCY8756394.1 hypothetical protein [Bacillus haynesii]MCY9218576.1 hypothetical protein [Bacillus haynesii]MCY9400310.1 hypothetical protein [Bacillus haynesii]MEC0709909.1 hypothetical protein [Bacillus haynesii]